MTTGLQSSAGTAILQRLAPLAHSMLRVIDERRFDECRPLYAEAERVLAEAKLTAEPPSESFLNDLYIIDGFFRLLTSYSDVWDHIVHQRFVASWGSLQDALDTTRMVKRLSGLEVEFLAAQLSQLEAAYPYN